MIPAPDPPFDELLVRCLDEMEREGSTALETACAAHPEHAERLRRRVEVLTRANLVDLGPTLARLPERLGEFEPLERLGAGGMGVVHRARQVSTGRVVALKLVRPEQLVFPAARARFQREVALSARLNHPAILPVLAVGEEGGLPWFAMELVHGASLADLLAALRQRHASVATIDPAELPALLREVTPASLREDVGRAAQPRSWTTFALETVLALVRALAHAHRKGILHRDVKPSNALVTGDGRVFLTDFGLASDPGEASLTRTSTAVGSLPYMAPELLEGEPADARSDLYGAGVLLYELLTLRRPYAAESAAALVGEILAGERVPPRHYARHLDPDAEAVVLRAIERDPGRRYATAEELAQDLQCLLDGRPTRARPLGPAARLARSVRRRPALSAALGLGLLALLAGPIGWEVQRMRSLRGVQAALHAESDARERADRHFHAALSAIGHVLRDTATDELEDVPRMQRARLTAIDRALELLTGIERDRPDDHEVARERARLSLARAQVLYDLRDLDPALAEFERCLPLTRELLAATPPDAEAERRELVEDLLGALRGEAKALQASLRHSRALEPLRGTVDLVRGQRAETPGDPALARRLAMDLANLAESENVVQGPRAARPLLVEGLDLVREALAASDDVDSHWAFGRLAQDFGAIELALGAGAPARESVARGLSAYRAAAERAPELRSLRFDVACGTRELAEFDAAWGDFARAEAGFRETIAILDQLVSDFPDSLRYRLERANVRGLFAVTLGSLEQRYAEAAAIQADVLADFEGLLATQPERCDWRIVTATAASNLANSLNNSGDGTGRAVELAERGLDLIAPCREHESFPTPVALQRLLLLYQRALGLCLANDLDRSHAAIEVFAAEVGQDARMTRFASDLWTEWILALRRVEPASDLRDELELAPRASMYETLRRAIDLGYRDVEELRRTPALEPFRGEREFQEILELLDG